MAVSWAKERGNSLLEGRTRASAYCKKHPYPLAAHSAELVGSNSVVQVGDVDWPVMVVEAAEEFDVGVEYGIQAQVATGVEVDRAVAEEEGEVDDVVAVVDVTSIGGGAPLSPAQRAEEWGSVTLSPPAAVQPATPAVVYAATATQPSATAARRGTTSAPGLVRPGVAMYATTLPSVAGPAPAYSALALQPSAPAPMYLATVPPALGPSGMFDPIYELLDGGGGDFGGVFQELVELGLSVVSIRDVLNALP